MADDSLTFKAAVGLHHNRMYDVVALLAAAAERIDAHAPPHSENPDKAGEMHNTMRLVQMAGELVTAAAEDFSRCL